MNTRKQRWLDALRSGKYEQGRRALCAYNYYCCLGVLADVDGALVLDCPGTGLRGTEYSYVMYLRGVDSPESLAQMNDSGCTFAEIADYIEKNVEVAEL